MYRQKSLLITSLSIGKQYQLRVTAGNLYGLGSPSSPVPAEIDASKVTKSKAGEYDSSARGKKIQVDDYDKYCKSNILLSYFMLSSLIKICQRKQPPNSAIYVQL